MAKDDLFQKDFNPYAGRLFSFEAGSHEELVSILNQARGRIVIEQIYADKGKHFCVFRSDSVTSIIEKKEN